MKQLKDINLDEIRQRAIALDDEGLNQSLEIVEVLVALLEQQRQAGEQAKGRQRQAG